MRTVRGPVGVSTPSEVRQVDVPPYSRLSEVDVERTLDDVLRSTPTREGSVEVGYGLGPSPVDKDGSLETTQLTLKLV